MTSEDVVKALRKSAKSLSEYADKLTATDPSTKDLAPGEGWSDGYWGEAYAQHEVLEDTINWLQCRPKYAECAKTVRCGLTRLDEADERALYGGDDTKHPIAAFQARRPSDA